MYCHNFWYRAICTYQNSNGFLISQQVPSDLAIEEYATFSIRVVDANGLPNTITQNSVIT